LPAATAVTLADVPQSLSVDLLLLRASAPDLALTPGRSLAARVLERGPQNVGILNLAGAILTAELPEDVKPGTRLRLVVQEATNERLLLQIAQPRESLAPALQPPAPPEVPLPGGGRLALLEREGGGASGDAGDAQDGAVTLRYELPALGAVELRVALDAAAARVRIALPAGALELAAQRAEELRAALEAKLGRPAEVSLVARRDPLDVYA
jgi:hypothetical protein